MIEFGHAGRLWALLALAVPVLLHLLARRAAPPVVFPPAVLLEDSAAGAFRRRRLRERLQLVLRMMALAALVLALARPRLPAAPGAFAAAEQRALVLVLDDSLSMTRPADPAEPGGASRLSRALEEARAALAALGPESEAAAIFASGRSLGPMAPAALAGELAGELAGGGCPVRRGGLAAALAAVPAFLDVMAPLRPAVAVLSDCEEGALEAASLAALRRRVPVNVLDMGARGAGGDWAVLGSRLDRGRMLAGDHARLMVRVGRAAGGAGPAGARRRLELVLNGTACAWTELLLEPGQEAETELSFTAGAGLQTGEVRLTGSDCWAANDRHPVALLSAAPVRLAVVCDAGGLDGPGRAVRLALSAGPGNERKAFLAELLTPEVLAGPGPGPGEFQVFVLVGPPAGDAGLWRALAARAANGAGLVVLADDAAALDLVAVPLGLPVPGAAGRLSAPRGAGLVPAGEGRELFHPLGRAAGAAVFTGALQLVPTGGTVLAQLRGEGVDGPGIVEWHTGRGTVLVAAFGASRSSGRLAEPENAALFVPLMHELAARAAGLAPAECAAPAGGDLAIRLDPRERAARFWIESGALRLPQGAAPADMQLHLRVPEEPGAWRLTAEAEGRTVSERPLAVFGDWRELAGRRGDSAALFADDGPSGGTAKMAALLTGGAGRELTSLLAGLCLLMMAGEILAGRRAPPPRGAVPVPVAGGAHRGRGGGAA